VFIVAGLSFWYDFRHGPGLQFFPTLLGINLVVVALRLLQLNGSYAHAERVRQRRLAEYRRSATGDDGAQARAYTSALLKKRS
jgi:hypothetical protein